MIWILPNLNSDFSVTISPLLYSFSLFFFLRIWKRSTVKRWKNLPVNWSGMLKTRISWTKAPKLSKRETKKSINSKSALKNCRQRYASVLSKRWHVHVDYCRSGYRSSLIFLITTLLFISQPLCVVTWYILDSCFCFRRLESDWKRTDRCPNRKQQIRRRFRTWKDR